MATVEKLITDIAAIRNAGMAALADKGVTTSADATVYDVIQKIADVYQAGTPEDLATLCATLLGVQQEAIADIDTLNTAMHTINTFALEFLAEHGATGVSANTLAIIGAYEELVEQGGGGGVQYSSIDYDAATNTYTLAEKDDPTITHTLTCTYDEQGRINGMVYDSKAISVEYNNDGTVTVGGTVVDVSEYVQKPTPVILGTVTDIPLISGILPQISATVMEE